MHKLAHRRDGGHEIGVGCRGLVDFRHDEDIARHAGFGKSVHLVLRKRAGFRGLQDAAGALSLDLAQNRIAVAVPTGGDVLEAFAGESAGRGDHLLGLGIGADERALAAEHLNQNAVAAGSGNGVRVFRKRRGGICGIEHLRAAAFALSHLLAVVGAATAASGVIAGNRGVRPLDPSS